MINNFEELKSEVKARLNVTDLLREITQIDDKGNGICPFHNDRRKGSFKVHQKSNTFRCFACDARGDALYLMQTRRGTDFITTVYELGYELGLICEDEMKNKRIMVNVRNMKGTNNKSSITYKNEIPKSNTVKDYKVKELSKNEIDLYDICYRVLSSYCGLNEEDKKHLLEVRKINSDKLNDYFSLKDLNEKNAVANTVNKLKSMNITEEQILSVPGFAKTKDNRIYIATHIRGLGMKVRNSEGKVVGIQIRTQLEDKKYIWLSSSSKGGSGSSTPVSIEYPKLILDGSRLNVGATINNAGNSILITEGKFKAQALSEEYQNISFGIAGINNWKGKVKKDFLNITNRKDINNVVLYADADCCYNPTIFMQFKEMINVELGQIMQNVYIAHWNIKYGKGVDDVIHSGNADKIKYLNIAEYSELFYEFLERINQFNINDVNSNREIKTQIYNRVFGL